jgi:hypothetical protein
MLKCKNYNIPGTYLNFWLWASKEYSKIGIMTFAFYFCIFVYGDQSYLLASLSAFADISHTAHFYILSSEQRLSFQLGFGVTKSSSKKTVQYKVCQILYLKEFYVHLLYRVRTLSKKEFTSCKGVRKKGTIASKKPGNFDVKRKKNVFSSFFENYRFTAASVFDCRVA